MIDTTLRELVRHPAYISALYRLNSDQPEYDAVTTRRFVDLLEEHGCFGPEVRVLFDPQTAMTFSADLNSEYDQLVWAFSNWISKPVLPMPLADFLRGVPALAARIADVWGGYIFSPYTFTVPHDTDSRVMWIDSDAAYLGNADSPWHAAMKKSRRDKRKSAIKRVETDVGPATFMMTAKLQGYELEWIKRQLAAKNDDDVSSTGYYTAQTLWGVAVQSNASRRVVWSTVYDSSGRTLSIASHLIKPDRIVLHSFTVDCETPQPSIGVYSMSRALCEFEARPDLYPRLYDPDVHCNINDGSDDEMSAYKRGVCNTMLRVPQLAVAHESGALSPPYYDTVRGWVTA